MLHIAVYDMNGYIMDTVCLFLMTFDYALCFMNCNAGENISRLSVFSA